MRWLAGAALAFVFGLLALPVVVLSAVPDDRTGSEPSTAAREEIPAQMLALYQQAAEQRCEGLSWSVLAGVGKVESDHGRLGGAQLQPDGTFEPPIIGPALDGSDEVRLVPDTDDGRWDNDPVLDRAVGPMQFLPATWEAVGIDASNTGVANPHHAVDATHSAAVYLCDHGADDPDRLRQALFAYNNSWSYVDQVLDHARRYETLTLDRADDADLIQAVLDNPRLTIYEAGRDDIASGEIDPRVLQLLQALSQDHELAVSSLKSGHSRCVGGGDYPGCTVSHHWHGRAVDIYRIDNRNVDATHTGARALVETLLALDGPLRPDEIGHPWPDLTGPTGSFSDAAHQGHLHLGWDQ